jgi:hypothetical protein
MNLTSTETRIDFIIQQMDEIIERCIHKKSKLGYFAVLYRSVTAEVKNKIQVGYFDDNERMQKLVIIFSSRYLDAIQLFWKDEQPSKSWQKAFEVT